VAIETNTVSDEQRQILWEQFVDTYVDSQESYDTSVRALAAAGVGITVTLGTALKHLEGAGLVAVLLFLASLAANLLSYVTAQRDMLERLVFLQDEEARADDKRAWGNQWTKWTGGLNTIAGTFVVLGGFFLAWFVWTTT
jgi:hypothetical protein